MFSRLFLISLLLSSAACSGSSDEADVEPPAAKSSAVANSGVTEAPDVKAVSFEDDASRNGGQREFAYIWPVQVSRIPKLAARLKDERDSDLAEQKAAWEENLASAGDDCIACRNLGYETEWKVVADLPRFLSLSANIYAYTGGAHGMYGLDTLVWDRETDSEIDGGSFFSSLVTLENALGAKLCDALDAERAKRRGGPVVRDGEWSTDCPSLQESTVLVGSSNGQTFDRIGVYFGPYTAGAYAEGAYELNFPVTASIIDAVKPQYAKAFTVKR